METTIQEIFRLALALSQHSPMATFVWYSGHVGTIHVEVWKTKQVIQYAHPNTIHTWSNVRLDDEYTVLEIIQTLEQLLKDQGCDLGHTGTTTLEHFSTLPTSESATHPASES